MTRTKRPDASAAAATRGTLSARQWSDIHRLATLAREQGVCFSMHGVEVKPADSTRTAGKPRNGTKEPTPTPGRTAEEPQPLETDGSVQPTEQTKKQQRDAKRLADHREKLRVAPILARWELLARQPLRAARRMFRDAVWTSWLREASERKQDARRKLRNLLRPYVWQEWSRRCIEPPARPALPAGAVRCPSGIEVLEPLSRRDEFILKRAKALWERAYPRMLTRKYAWRWLRQPQPGSASELDSLGGGSPAERRHAALGLLGAGKKHASTPPPRKGSKKKAGGRES